MEKGKKEGDKAKETGVGRRDRQETLNWTESQKPHQGSY